MNLSRSREPGGFHTFSTCRYSTCKKLLLKAKISKFTILKLRIINIIIILPTDRPIACTAKNQVASTLWYMHRQQKYQTIIYCKKYEIYTRFHETGCSWHFHNINFICLNAPWPIHFTSSNSLLDLSEVATFGDIFILFWNICNDVAFSIAISLKTVVQKQSPRRVL